ncbi:MAG TPA: twin-arginine translocation signal domain-containing protein [Chthoniobacterales bacterium]|nr:twin-arginine translocation signal domain-containing protein [Chthoniobacterales bacterium]
MKTPSKHQLTTQPQSPSQGQSGSSEITRNGVRRRAFIKGLGVTGAALLPATALFINKAGAQVSTDASDDGGGALTAGDASLLRFVAAAEIIESDLWEQYWELGGTQLDDFAATNPATGQFVTPTGGNQPYTKALQILDGDMPQYILDNTDDEFSHANFLLGYLKSKGANTSDIDLLAGPHFRTLNGSVATGSTKKLRLTNLTQLTVDTNFWGLYRTDSANPDLGGTNFARAVPSLNVGRHTAIPRTDADTTNKKLIKAIAFTAGFHFPFIEIHGTSLYPQLAQRATNPEVLRVLLSIGPTEAMHFQTWQDKAGNATPVSVFDPINGFTVTFVDLTKSTDEHLQANLIMPEPCPFLSTQLPICSIVRPTATKGAAMAAAKTLIADGLFIGQTQEFFQLLQDLATDADAAPGPG